MSRRDLSALVSLVSAPSTPWLLARRAVSQAPGSLLFRLLHESDLASRFAQRPLALALLENRDATLDALEACLTLFSPQAIPYFSWARRHALAGDAEGVRRRRRDEERVQGRAAGGPYDTLLLTAHSVSRNEGAALRVLLDAEAAAERAGLQGPADALYRALVVCYGRLGKADRAAWVVERMRGRGVAPSAATLGALVDAYAESVRPQAALEVLEQLERAERGAGGRGWEGRDLRSEVGSEGDSEVGSEVDSEVRSEGESDVADSQTRQGGLSFSPPFPLSSSSSPASSLSSASLPSSSPSSTSTPRRAPSAQPTTFDNAIHYTMVAKAFARTGDVEGVGRVLSAMERSECPPPVRQFAYSILLSALARTRRAHAAENVVAQMRGQGVGVTGAHLAPLLSAYQRVGRPLEELLQLERREREAVRGSQAFYATLVQACARHGDYASCHRLYESQRATVRGSIDGSLDCAMAEVLMGEWHAGGRSSAALLSRALACMRASPAPHLLAIRHLAPGTKIPALESVDLHEMRLWAAQVRLLDAAATLQDAERGFVSRLRRAGADEGEALASEERLLRRCGAADAGELRRARLQVVVGKGRRSRAEWAERGGRGLLRWDGKAGTRRAGAWEGAEIEPAPPARLRATILAMLRPLVRWAVPESNQGVVWLGPEAVETLADRATREGRARLGALKHLLVEPLEAGGPPGSDSHAP